MPTDSPPIYLLPGVNKSYPVFEHLEPQLPNATIVDYPAAEPGESLCDYAGRVAQQLSPHAVLIGLSFGGVLAQELVHFLPMRACVLIATVRGPHQFPPHYRWSRRLGIRGTMSAMRVASHLSLLIPKRFYSRTLARAGRAGPWQRWAMASVANWHPRPAADPPPTLQIHGSADTTFPLRYVEADVVVDGGRHALPVSHPDEVLQAIRQFFDSLQIH